MTVDPVAGLWPLWAVLIAYAILRFWLPAVAKRDMDRRGQQGWAYELAQSPPERRTLPGQCSSEPRLGASGHALGQQEGLRADFVRNPGLRLAFHGRM